MYIVASILIIVGLASFWYAHRQRQKAGRVGSLRLTKISEAQAGQHVALFGQATTTAPLTSPYGQKPVIYYHVVTEQETEKRDAQGRTTTQWEVARKDQQSVPFWLQDASGTIAIYPEGASLEGQASFSGPANGLQGQRIRVTEHALFINTPTLVIGTISSTPTGMVITKNEGDFIVSFRTLDQLRTSFAFAAMLSLIAGIILVIGGVYFFIQGFISQ